MFAHDRLPHCSLPPPTTAPAPGAARALLPASLVRFDGGALAAWVRGRAVGFGGFSDERAAADAALVAYAALSCWVDARRYTPPPLPATLRPTVCADAPDGARWVLADGLPIARLVDARAVGAGDGGGDEAGPVARPAGDTSEAHHGFEIEVPLPVDALGVRRAAYAVYRALCRSELPWRLWAAGRRARRVHVAPARCGGPPAG